jgi:hypothetical protein
MALLLRCDIVLVRKKGAFLSTAIRFFEAMKDNKSAIASHTGLITKSGVNLDATITEALPHVVEHKLVDEYGSDPKAELCVFRPLNLTDADERMIIAKAESYVGDGYGYAKLLAQLADDLLGSPYLFRRLCRIDNRPICSYVVGAAFNAVGLNFGVPYRAVSPDDIWDFCISHPDKYQFVWQQGTMYV